MLPLAHNAQATHPFHPPPPHSHLSPCHNRSGCPSCSPSSTRPAFASRCAWCTARSTQCAPQAMGAAQAAAQAPTWCCRCRRASLVCLAQGARAAAGGSVPWLAGCSGGAGMCWCAGMVLPAGMGPLGAHSGIVGGEQVTTCRSTQCTWPAPLTLTLPPPRFPARAAAWVAAVMSSRMVECLAHTPLCITFHLCLPSCPARAAWEERMTTQRMSWRRSWRAWWRQGPHRRCSRRQRRR